MEVAVISQINKARTTKSTCDQKVTLFDTGFTDNLHDIGSGKMLGKTCLLAPFLDMAHGQKY